MRSELEKALHGTAVKHWRQFEIIGSTNDEALAWAESGAPDFSLVIADKQSGGRGRFDRVWTTEPGSSLAFSLILRLSETERAHIPQYAPLCGIAVHSAVEQLLGISAEIKWPNDVLINRKKFCGILVEAAWRDGALLGVVLGIGLNVNTGSVPSSTAQGFPATCLQQAAGRPVERFALLRDTLLALAQWRSRLGTPEFIQCWQNNLAFRGEWVRIEHGEKPATIGKIIGIDDSGQLLLSDEQGAMISVLTGDVRLRPITGSNQGGTDA